MKDKTIISASTLVVSLLAYCYAKATEKDATPLVMLGGFVGALLGDGIVDQLKKTDEL